MMLCEVRIALAVLRPTVNFMAGKVPGRLEGAGGLMTTGAMPGRKGRHHCSSFKKEREILLQ